MSSKPVEQISPVELIDGSMIFLRQLDTSDADEVVRLYETLTDEECYLHFFTLRPAQLQARVRSLTEHSDKQYALALP